MLKYINNDWIKLTMISLSIWFSTLTILCDLLGADFKKGHSSQLHGINHISITTMNINKTLDFFVNELGGYLVDNIQPSNLQSKFYNWLLDVACLVVYTAYKFDV